MSHSVFLKRKYRQHSSLKTYRATIDTYSAGGMFSNTKDLIAFGEAIQNNKLLSPAQTRAWMKPETHTSSLGVSVGGSWEILRSDNITADGRLIDVYTKSGDLGLYHALLGIVPDYDIVVSVITAGAEVTIDPYARSKLFSAVIQTILPAVEAAGRDEAARFEGTFVDESSNSSLVLSSDSGPGLLIESFSVRGFDVLNNIGSYSIGTAGSGSGLSSQPSDDDTAPAEPSIEGRLYPTKRTSTSDGGSATAWRGIFDGRTEEQIKELEDSIYWIDASCETWLATDRSAYNFLSISDFHIVESEDGDVKSIKNPAFNVTLTKVRQPCRRRSA
jgi:hypothetical protein